MQNQMHIEQRAFDPCVQVMRDFGGAGIGPCRVQARVVRPAHGGVLHVHPSLPAQVEKATAGARIAELTLFGMDPVLDAEDTTFGRRDAFARIAETIDALAPMTDTLRIRTRAGLVGSLDPVLAAVLVKHAARIVVELGIVTMDIELSRALEGRRVATPEARLRFAGALTARGVAVHAAMDPMVPLLTDQRAALDAVLSQLVGRGVYKVSVRYLVFTPERARALGGRLSRLHRELLKSCFADVSWHQADAGHASPYKEVSPELRHAGHQRVLHAASQHGLSVAVLDPVEPYELQRAHTTPLMPKRAHRAPSSDQMDLFKAAG